MSLKSIVKRTLGLKRHYVKSIKYNDDPIVIELENRQGRRQPCGQCGSLVKVRDRLKTRTWKHVPLWGIKVIINYRPVRVSCDKYQAVKVENIPWADGKSPLTHGFIWLLAAWAKLLPWKVV